jgi:hypothetical protein
MPREPIITIAVTPVKRVSIILIEKKPNAGAPRFRHESKDIRSEAEASVQ